MNTEASWVEILNDQTLLGEVHISGNHIHYLALHPQYFTAEQGINEISNLSQVESISVNFGETPPTKFSIINCPNLRELKIKGKAFNKDVELVLKGCNIIRHLEIDAPISIDLSNAHTNLKELEDLALSECRTNSTIVLPDKLNALSIENCKITEITLPESLFRLTLRNFTNFPSPLPPRLGVLESDQISIDSLTLPPSLQHLYLSNSVRSEIPYSLNETLPSLEILCFYNITIGFIEVNNLSELFLSECHFSQDSQLNGSCVDIYIYESSGLDYKNSIKSLNFNSLDHD